MQILGVGKHITSKKLENFFQKFPPSVKIVCCQDCEPCVSRRWCADYTNVCAGLPHFRGTRVQRIAKARNLVLDHILDIDMVAIVDLDICIIAPIFKKYWQYGKVMTFGQIGGYYDTWAFRDGHMGNNFVKDKTYNWHQIAKYVQRFVSPREVQSAFGGIALIYPAPPKQCRYLESDDDCEHVKYNACLRKNGQKVIVDTKIKLIAKKRHC